MPPADPAGPPCPKCLSPITDRLPFGDRCHPLPVYACLDCGCVWEDPDYDLILTSK
jgi:hypothetical protein